MIKLANLYKQLIGEGISQVVYHKTSLGALYSILTEDEFILTSSVGANSDKKSQDKLYYLSTTRSNTGYYKNQVSIKLDGDKLGQRYRGMPVDYWQYSSQRAAYPNDQKYTQVLASKELEDRIVSNNPTIPNALKYIIDISIVVDSAREKQMDALDIWGWKNQGKTDSEIDKMRGDFVINSGWISKNKQRLLDIMIIAKKNNIPVYFYYTEGDLKSNNKNRSIPNTTVINLLQSAKSPIDTSTYISRSSYDRLFKILTDLYFAKGKGDLNTDESLKYITKLIDDTVWYDETLRVISSDFHNMRTRADKSRHFNRLVQIMQTKKWDIPDLIKFLVNKWTPLLAHKP